MSKPLAWLLVGCWGLVGCTAGPDYHRPKLAMPVAYSGSAWMAANPQDRTDRGSWWEVFHDAELNRLETLAMQSNTSLAVAVAQRDQAEAQLRAADAGFWPTLSLTAQQTRNRSYFFSTANHSAGLQAAWEPDLWGAVRRAVEQQRDLLQASDAQMASVRLSIAAQLAQAYFNLQTQVLRQRLDEQNVKINQDLLDATLHQEAAGTVSQAAEVQVKSQLESAQAQAEQDRWQVEQLTHAVALLCGQPAEDFTIKVADDLPVLPSIPPGLPATLLQRRPDIANAERAMAAANAAIGVAASAYFPTIDLAASVSFASNRWGNWLTAPYRYWSLGPSLTELLFDGGRRHALEDSAKASYRQAVATYRGQVLTALQEVEDDLSALHGLQRQGLMTRASLQDAQQAWKITQNEYAAGTLAYPDVLNSELAMYNQQLADLNLHSLQMNNTVLLIQSLGGIW
ncbi:MAG: efflux transporter outer membrane subunit [Pseudomonadales bacterium]|nr:efflux transporter outer membrane subunit [Pseudomonadales bacterium]